MYIYPLKDVFLYISLIMKIFPAPWSRKLLIKLLGYLRYTRPTNFRASQIYPFLRHMPPPINWFMNLDAMIFVIRTVGFFQIILIALRRGKYDTWPKRHHLCTENHWIKKRTHFYLPPSWLGRPSGYPGRPWRDRGDWRCSDSWQVLVGAVWWWLSKPRDKSSQELHNDWVESSAGLFQYHQNKISISELIYYFYFSKKILFCIQSWNCKGLDNMVRQPRQEKLKNVFTVNMTLAVEMA